eukprot:TRINITY_DN17586_c2_g1_i1.p1 TRINITY_DN17586_c2_g1~~TRINITY_DN17586_c2_g1_i1.p1  ORF type:complete len:107 (+),score=9.00 TRINITY_DN17586_c2_g1_i1:146-466(+)
MKRLQYPKVKKVSRKDLIRENSSKQGPTQNFTQKLRKLVSHRNVRSFHMGRWIRRFHKIPRKLLTNLADDLYSILFFSFLFFLLDIQYRVFIVTKMQKIKPIPIHP